MFLNQTALITGASSGIGVAIAVQLASEGYDLILLGRNEQNLEASKAKCLILNPEIKVKTLAFDLKKIDAYQDSIIHLINNLNSPLSILVNNAGIFKTGHLNESTTLDWQELFEVNLLSQVRLTQIVWTYFKNNKSGCIINISSTLGLKPTANTGAYSALKAALINWTISLAQEGGRFNIRANCICPGVVDTPIHSFHHLPENEKELQKQEYAKFQLLNFVGQPEHIAHSVSFLASEKSKWTTGAIVSVDGGINIK